MIPEIVGQREEGEEGEEVGGRQKKQALGTAVMLSQLLWCPWGRPTVGPQWSQVESGREELPQRLRLT